ncbi:MAG: UDP-galactose phosphate transferase [Acidobacteria bacterium]|nr:MAG: UDP-galactose phosphate transferase [Acidobacteriota bacterium]
MKRFTPEIPCWKRSFDIAVASAALVLTLPLMLFIWIAVRISLGKPAVFRQRRPGLGSQPFIIYKFRTMRCQKECGDAPDEKRLTQLGGLLRRTSLDELPELWNVLRGEMSLVGPRPLLMQYLNRYSTEQLRRHEVCPGITGWAQVNGRNAITWEERFALDVWYVEHQSFWLDLKILCMTLPRALTREGVNQQGHATMPEFIGSAEKQFRT